MMRIPARFDPRRVSAAVCALLLAACWTSPTPRKVALADQARGAAVTLYMTDGVVHSGELLAVRDSSLLLLLGERIAVAPLSAIQKVTFAADGSTMTGQRAQTVNYARRAARFPFGITPAALKVMLQQSGQDAPIELRAGAP